MLESAEDSLKIKHLARRYTTTVPKYKTSFKKEIRATDTDLVVQVDKHTTKDLIKLTRSDGTMLYADSTTIKSGKKIKMSVPKDSTVTLEFPVYPQLLQYSGTVTCRHSNNNLEKTEWDNLSSSSKCAAVAVYAMHQAFCLVGGDESIWGFGKRAQGVEDHHEVLRKIELPEGCKNYKKVVHGKFFRLILTEDNRIFFNGQNRKYMFGSAMQRNTHVDHMFEVP